MTPSPVATLPPPAPAAVRTPVVVATDAPAPPPVQVLAFAEPLPGFPVHRDYVLVPADAGGLLFWLQSVAPDGPRFLAVPAASFFPTTRRRCRAPSSASWGCRIRPMPPCTAW